MTAPGASAARLFRALHEDGMLVLANVWDAGSARLMESLGARAVATSSAAVAWSHGYPDGDALPVKVLAATVAEIARVIRVPLTVDIEGGYSGDAAAVGDNVAMVLDAGGVGINLEDGAGSPDLLCAKIEEARRAGSRKGVELFVNARTDPYLRELGPPERRVEETLARAERYRAAGADGIFVPGVVERTEIRTIASGTKLPLNVLARPGLPAAAELAELGVKRLSAGSWIAEAILGRAASLARAFLHDGRSEPLAEGAMPYGELNSLMKSG
jgi:2-methylisocitrate lyase-like PEP mutase family enzyme